MYVCIYHVTSSISENVLVPRTATILNMILNKSCFLSERPGSSTYVCFSLPCTATNPVRITTRWRMDKMKALRFQTAYSVVPDNLSMVCSVLGGGRVSIFLDVFFLRSQVSLLLGRSRQLFHGLFCSGRRPGKYFQVVSQRSVS